MGIPQILEENAAALRDLLRAIPVSYTHLDALLDAADFVAAFQKRQGMYISCIEEIAYRRGFIDKEQLVKLAQPLLKTAYGQYLIDVANGL